MIGGSPVLVEDFGTHLDPTLQARALCVRVCVRVCESVGALSGLAWNVFAYNTTGAAYHPFRR